MTHDEHVEAVRLGYWLRRVRESQRETLSSAALAAGLSRNSGSTVHKWEMGQRPIKRVHLHRLARFYGVPASFFTNPQKTDDERLAEALADALDLERQDAELGPEDGPPGADGRGARPRRPH